MSTQRVLSLYRQRPRILAVRPLRPPAARSQPFTQHRRKLLLVQHAQRPQLPYLSQSSSQQRLSPLDQQTLRLLSTKSRDFVKDYTFRTITWGFAAWAIIGLINVMLYGLAQEFSEKEHPTPSEWSFWTRNAVRNARLELEAYAAQGYIKWANVGSYYSQALKRLEDPNGDGAGVVPQEAAGGGDIMIADVGAIGPDVSAKSWQWRQGYFEVLIGMAQASENMEHMVRDTSRNLIFPKSTMIGPSNPDPRPVTKNMAAAPLEENCERAFEPPEKFYVKILTGNGFTTRQKLTAALAYANWLDHSGLPDAAGEMLKWSVDIAKTPLDRQDVFKPGTYVLSSGYATENLLRAVTEYGVNQARTGNTNAALPILLAVYKARQEAESVPPPPASRQHALPQTDLDAAVYRIRRLFTQTQFPETLSSGNEPYQRPFGQTCEDSQLMLYLGEIMYASSSMKAEGLAWTKRGVEVAEKELENPSSTATDIQQMKDEARKCKHCLKTGVENWTDMLEDIQRSAEEKPTGVGSWMPWSSTKISNELMQETTNEAELQRLDQLKGVVLRNSYAIEAEDMRKSNKFAMYTG